MIAILVTNKNPLKSSPLISRSILGSILSHKRTIYVVGVLVDARGCGRGSGNPARQLVFFATYNITC